MDETRIVLSGIWVALMLTYLLGDVLRIFAGGITPGEISGKQVSQGAWLGMAVLMLIPIVMVVLTLEALATNIYRRARSLPVLFWNAGPSIHGPPKRRQGTEAKTDRNDLLPTL